MHDSVMEFVRDNLPVMIERTVLEVGSYDVNGSVRSLIEPYAVEYVGCDIREGPGVDVVCDAAEADRLGSFNLVVSTEMLEHAEDWREALRGMVRATKLGGNILLTTRGPGAGRHEHPEDYWRFTCEIIEKAFVRLGVIGTVRNDPGQGYTDGVFFEGMRILIEDDELTDLVADVAPPPWYA